MRYRILGSIAILTTLALCFAIQITADDKKSTPFTIVVMDPLALPLSCPCVKGYAQRDYEQLAKYLESQIHRPVKVAFSESLTVALKTKTSGQADLIIGKVSVVRHAAQENGLDVTPVASLTGKDGKTTQTGLFVVAAGDKALTVADLQDYQIIFGPGECEEKHSAALRLLAASGLPAIDKPETCAACSDGATKILELHRDGTQAATVISSYAQPLLEGCGTIKKGDLRVIGETEPVPFVAAFVNDRLSEAERRAVQSALLSVGQHPQLCTALETKLGFVGVASKKK